MTDVIQQHFKEQAQNLGITLTDHQMSQFETYYSLLVEWNEKMNLTGITERDAVYEKHFYDSLTVAGVVQFDKTTSLADIGSGAGFPSVPLAIAFPHLQVTIIDALAKRIKFLEEVTSQLGLSKVLCLHSRAEDAARKREHRDHYDVVTARAVARLAVLNEFCLPFTRPGGLFVAMKGTDVSTELDEGRYSLAKLNGKIQDVKRLKLPTEGADRHLVICAKKEPTPAAYPRKAGIPLKTPLVKPSLSLGSK
ncbi:16S rRNA (guanine(527)-N(7))-methyltransferase RsmG [Cohnella cholangitidis]|uniref:Ribosomal RNA small subunit methyltransferase G n=1 Tax=Cohnella cholangitidis TaxID=2598458 RepID=A0A7G5BZ02_9BACL|nr:16S rRNA (guanine(527)-N(7))-methyltransferase RsmG [Cohnella cholangitidis]QMV42186.1 16S rRNA (guanine(527)-N(7))-methyltransferase RsmG [Cohnella cholangitidis]